MTAGQIIESISNVAIPGYSVAVGNDIVHLPTFDLSFTPQFIRRGYTPGEIAYCEQFSDSRLRYASTWAAKEAVYKVMKQVAPAQKLWWSSIEIQRSRPQGKPTVSIKKLQFQPDISLTISHDGDYVWALALCVTPYRHMHQQVLTRIPLNDKILSEKDRKETLRLP